jgi:hypothetical protein
MYLSQVALTAVIISLVLLIQVVLSSLVTMIASKTKYYDAALITQFQSLTALNQFVFKSDRRGWQRAYNATLIITLLSSHVFSLLFNHLWGISGHTKTSPTRIFYSFKDRVDPGGQSFYDNAESLGNSSTVWLYRQLPSFNVTAVGSGYDIDYSRLPVPAVQSVALANCTANFTKTASITFCYDMYDTIAGENSFVREYASTNESYRMVLEINNTQPEASNFEPSVINTLLAIQSSDSTTLSTGTVLYNSATMAYNTATQTGGTGLSGGAGTSIVYSSVGDATSLTIKVMKFVCVSSDCNVWKGNGNVSYWRDAQTVEDFSSQIPSNSALATIRSNGGYFIANIMTNTSRSTGSIASYTSVTVALKL